MKMKTVFLSFLIALAGLAPAIALAQDEDVRGAFMTTRPKATGSASGNKSTSSPRPSRRHPKTPAPNPTGPGPVNPNGPSTPAKVNVPRIGLGLTLFMRDSNGLAVRTDPSHVFHKGDHVRVLIETNADGYLYVFNTTDNGQPLMLYPDPQLDEAGNYFQAHVPFEIPSSLAAEERLRWLTFDANPGAEKIYFVFTREPLGAVPIEDDLITFCRENEGKCPWSPGAEVWAQIQKEMSEPVTSAKRDRSGKAQTASERQAATRGIGLNRDDPEPSLIMLTGSTSKNMLVVSLDLIHKSDVDDSNDDVE
ncbi:MAG TPA: DUF4384 domain-containing protein [Pyrinomonadaceae bacterium]|nr:DUF4384 domain-containing protein [Pyrinomonadaceae bacterium]